MTIRPVESRWRTVVVGTLVLLVSALVPVPFGRRPKWGRLGPDKLLHFVGHAGYTIALSNAFHTGDRSDEAAIKAVAVSFGLGLVVGRAQEWVPGRANEPWDLFAGLLGSVVAAVVWRAKRVG